MKKRIAILFFLIILLGCLTGCKENNSSKDIKNKITEELNYLDVQIVAALNKLNNLTFDNYTITLEEIQMGQKSSKSEQDQSNSQSSDISQNEKNSVNVTSMEQVSLLDLDETNVDWTAIKNQIETINSAWGVIILDLTSMNVENTDILNFSNCLNNTLLSIKDENKQNTLINLAKLYSFIPKFEEQIGQNDEIKNIKLAKSYLINAYSVLEQDDWTEIEKNISNCEEAFKNVMNNLEYIKNKEFKINKSYVLIKELQNSISYKDKKIFLVKYSNVLESINTL